jgi:hypothetical protein
LAGNRRTQFAHRRGFCNIAYLVQPGVYSTRNWKGGTEAGCFSSSRLEGVESPVGDAGRDGSQQQSDEEDENQGCFDKCRPTLTT